MSADRIADVATGAGAAGGAAKPSADGSDRAKLALVAAEFESMLLVQMLRDMRTLGKWDQDSEADTLGAETFYQTIDVELASHLSKARGFGLGRQLLDAYDQAAPVVVDPVVSGFSRTGAIDTVTSGFSRTEPGAETTLALPAGTVTSAFGWRSDPLHGAARFHKGIDVRAAYGEDVRSAGPGRVVFSGQQGGYGTTVVVEHADGVQTRYAHLSASLVAAGDEIHGGHVLGRAGRSGRATGTHLHFEILAGGRPVDPQRIGLKPEGVVADLTGEGLTHPGGIRAVRTARTATGPQESAAHDHQD